MRLPTGSNYSLSHPSFSSQIIKTSIIYSRRITFKPQEDKCTSAEATSGKWMELGYSRCQSCQVVVGRNHWLSLQQVSSSFPASLHRIEQVLAELCRHKHMQDVLAKQTSLEGKYKWWSESQPKMVKGWGLAMENFCRTSSRTPQAYENFRG